MLASLLSADVVKEVVKGGVGVVGFVVLGLLGSKFLDVWGAENEMRYMNETRQQQSLQELSLATKELSGLVHVMVETYTGTPVPKND